MIDRSRADKKKTSICLALFTEHLLCTRQHATKVWRKNLKKKNQNLLSGDSISWSTQQK